MAVLNPPRSLPGLGRAIINFLTDSRRSWTEDELIEVFKPPGLNDSGSAHEGMTNTILAFKAVGMLSFDECGAIAVTDTVVNDGNPLTQTRFRRQLQKHVLDLGRDGDPWQTSPGEAHTSGARDLTRALSWFLAQDALGNPLSWTDNVQTLQSAQFQSQDNETWAITNDTRWGALTRWAPALGLASTSVVRGKGLVPLPVAAINDVLDELPAGQISIGDFLSSLTTELPVLHGGLARSSLATHLPKGDPDPGVAEDCVDSSVGQALRVLEDRHRLNFDNLPDAEGVRLSRFDSNRVTHVTVHLGGME
jgi:hypothetical protein